MAIRGDSRDRPGIDFGKSKLYFGMKFCVGCLLAVGVVVICLNAEAWKWPSGNVAAVTTLVGSVIGILFAPSPKPLDHSKVANSSVERLLDMRGEFERARQTITELAGDPTHEPATAFRLLATQDAMLRQDEHFERTVSDWDEVSPGVVDRVVHKRNEGRRIFRKLAKETS
ncbi:hypothetical protein [Neomicrococcus lactis]|uniref:hypothetical protein n=1 Tax=Neomicrococcus lactis TaxID=732241 RepID=UPI0023009C6B|nr:hypothetical protein [Neomicrococcus lactis]